MSKVIRIEPNPHRVRVRLGGKTLADTMHAVTLYETPYPPRQYVPRQDVDMSLLSRTDRHTHCPYKGDCTYYSIKADGKVIENAVWSYEQPIPSAVQIAGHLAFYPDKVDITVDS